MQSSLAMLQVSVCRLSGLLTNSHSACSVTRGWTQSLQTAEERVRRPLSKKNTIHITKKRGSQRPLLAMQTPRLFILIQTIIES